MKAAIRRKYCNPDQINVEELDIPIPGKREVLVKVHYTTVNRTDCAILTAKPFIMRFVNGLFKPRKIILGTDFAGEAIETGSEVKSFKKGDRVFGFIDTGVESQAEFTNAKAKYLFKIPENISYKQAAASLEGAHYAYSFIHKVKIQNGQDILINGATGGIGSALIQLVQQYDVTITATCNTKNMDLIKSLGADKTIDYTKEDFTKESKKYDYIFDAVGKSTFGKCKPLLKEKGIYVSSELGPNSENLFFALAYPLMKKKVIIPVPFTVRRSIPYICNLISENKFNAIIDREYTLDDISKAYAFTITGQKTGNVILNIYNSNPEK